MVLPVDDRVDGRAELVAGVAVAAYVTLFGAVAGLVWAGLAPQLSVPQLVAQSSSVYRAQIGADAWFLLVGTVAGALCAVVLALVLRRRGPGALLGLIVGGLAASFVADRVGFLAQRGSTVSALHAAGLRADEGTLQLIDFKLR